jgi:antitoxin HigA-1
MLPRHRIPSHPGEILREEFSVPLGITPAALARHIGMATQRISELARERRRVTPELAWLLGQALGTTAEFWSNLQSKLRPGRPSADEADRAGSRGRLSQIPNDREAGHFCSNAWRRARSCSVVCHGPCQDARFCASAISAGVKLPGRVT